VLDESQDKTVSAVDDLQDADRHQQSERVTDAVYLSALPHPPSVTVGAALALSAAALALASCGNGSNDGSQNNATQPAR
jgi:2-methylcitrate dehydratase PrpD